MIILAGFALYTCGNPGIQRGLIKDPNTQLNKNKTLELINDNRTTMKLRLFTLEDLDNYAADRDILTEQRYYRAPPLTYILFEIKNKGTQPIEFNLFESFFIDNNGRKYYPLIEREYKGRFTSAAYDRFKYQPMYSFYYKAEKVERTSPGKMTTLPPGKKGSQVLPFEFFDSSAYRYQFQVELPAGKVENFDLFYRSKRLDHP